MCIIVKNNKICIHDVERLDHNDHYNHDDHTMHVEIEHSDTPETLLSWVKMAKDVKSINECPVEWKDRVTRHEYCAVIKEQLEHTQTAKTKSDKEAFKNGLLDIIKASLITYNSIVEND